MQYVLTTNNLCKHYGKFKVLNNLTMQVPKGSIYGFIGKNGSGKTTLIRQICGLQIPTSGEFTLYEKNFKDKEILSARKRIGAIVETPAFFLDMTAQENLKHQYRILGLPSFDGIEEILKLVSLENVGNKKARNFSLGMKQRLGIAVALCSNPDFLILDEPINGLDPQGIIEIRELILRLNREEQITVLISSHFLDELSKIATHYGFIDNGAIIKQISREELEKVCKKSTRVTVSSSMKLVQVAEEMGIEYKVISSTEVNLFDKINISKLVIKLQELDCELISSVENDESLESYFINLVGGA